MHYMDLNKISDAPDRGQMLAYTRKQLIFQEYAGLEDVKQRLGNDEVLELHLFDQNCEYRAMASRSPRFPEGAIEAVVQFAEADKSEIYQETVELENGFGTMEVLNHIWYDPESGMAHIDNYRLRMGERQNG